MDGAKAREPEVPAEAAGLVLPALLVPCRAGCHLGDTPEEPERVTVTACVCESVSV